MNSELLLLAGFEHPFPFHWTSRCTLANIMYHWNILEQKQVPAQVSNPFNTSISKSIPGQERHFLMTPGSHQPKMLKCILSQSWSTLLESNYTLCLLSLNFKLPLQMSLGEGFTPTYTANDWSRREIGTNHQVRGGGKKKIVSSIFHFSVFKLNDIIFLLNLNYFRNVKLQQTHKWDEKREFTNVP